MMCFIGLAKRERGMSPSELVKRMSERTPEGVTDHDQQQLDVFETESS